MGNINVGAVGDGGVIVGVQAVLGGAALFCFHTAGIDLSAVIVELVRLVEAPTLIAIPLFTFAGYVLAESKAPERLLDFYRAWFGWIPAGLPFVALTACAFFTAFTGASGITIIALGSLILPVLTREKYSEKFALGLVTTSGSLGLLFPPSLPIILYGLVAQVRIDHLFLAGILPGILLVSLLGLYGVWAGRGIVRERYPFNRTRAWKACWGAFWELLLPVFLVAAIYGGLATTNETAALTVAYVLIVELLIRKELQFKKDIVRVALESMILVGGVLTVLGCAMGFTNFLVDAQVPMHLLAWLKQYISSPLVFLLLLNVFLLLAACLIDGISAIIVLVPLILPFAKGFDINPLHLGIIFLTNLEIGYLMPPAGINLFLSSFRFKKPMTEVYAAAFPFFLVLLAGLAIVTYVPFLSLALPEWWK